MKRLVAGVILFSASIALLVEGMYRTLNQYGGLTIPAIILGLVAIGLLVMGGFWFHYEMPRLCPDK